MQIVYNDVGKEICLRNYADTIVLDRTGQDTPIMAAIRFGGYPEQVKGMSDALYGGGEFSIEYNGSTLRMQSAVKQYRREYAYDGLYAEATLLIQDELLQADDADSTGAKNTISNENDNTNGIPSNDTTSIKSKPRKCYIYCEPDKPNQLFAEIDAKTAVPMMPDFQDYVLSELQDRNILQKLEL